MQNLFKVAGWNKTAVPRFIWNLFASVGSIWVAWVKADINKK